MYFGYFFLTFLISLFLTPAVRNLMRRFNIVDLPRTEARKIHKQKIPLGGGLAIFASFFLVVLLVIPKMGDSVEIKYLWALFLGGLVLMLGGILDDKYNLRPKQQIIFPLITALLIIVFGIGRCCCCFKTFFIVFNSSSIITRFEFFVSLDAEFFHVFYFK